MFDTDKRLALAAMCMWLSMMGGCAMFGGSPQGGKAGAAAQAQGGAPQLPPFPDRASASLKEGVFPNVENLRKMAPGMSKVQVYDLLGAPHFGEGVFGVHEWNYIFNFRTGRGGEFVTCQYQVFYDKDMHTSVMRWDRPECEALVFPRPVAAPAPVPPPAPAPRPAPRRITLSADTLFAFDRSDIDSMSPQGRRRLDEVAREIRGVDVERVLVVGHADRIGPPAYNDRLSAARAASVVRYLVNAGVPSAVISSEGRGAREPVVQCNMRNRAELIACLAPNRRVVIDIQGRAAQR